MVQLDARLLEILVCPCGKGAELEYKERRRIVRCLECTRTFPVVDGVPQLILDEATAPKTRGSSS